MEGQQNIVKENPTGTNLNTHHKLCSRHFHSRCTGSMKHSAGAQSLRLACKIPSEGMDIAFS